MIKVGIVGATGYTGIELVRILAGHSEVNITTATSRSYKGQRLDRIFPSLLGIADLVCTDLQLEKLADECDVVFIALPHGHAAEVAEAVLQRGKKAIDLGADFRLNNSQIYRQWYEGEPPADNLLAGAIYGLPEINREKIAGASLVANPGCYPTSAILALAPLIRNNLVELDSIIIDAKSGVSGAGRSLSLGAHYAEVNESFRAYKVASHRHTPEIEQELSKLTSQEIIVSFTPHLVPMTRGILATSYAKAKGAITEEELTRIYVEQYAQEQFVQVLEDQLPQTNWVAGTNNCHIKLTYDKRTRRIVVVSAIDNLIKGAAGQAVQNMNLMFGLDEQAGLTAIGLYP